MVEGSLVFLPLNQSAFDDARSSFVFDDAKSYFSYQRERFMDALLLFDDFVLAPLLAGGVPANSDFRPILDLGAERARFDRAFAHGAYSFATSPFDLTRLLKEEVRLPSPYSAPPVRGMISLVNSQRGAWLREAMSSGGAYSPAHFPEWRDTLLHLRTFLLLSQGVQQGRDGAPLGRLPGLGTRGSRRRRARGPRGRRGALDAACGAARRGGVGVPPHRPARGGARRARGVDPRDKPGARPPASRRARGARGQRGTELVIVRPKLTA